MSISVFETSNFKAVQTYQSNSQHLAIKDDTSQSNRNRSVVERLIKKVLDETENGVTDEYAEAYEAFLSNVEVIDKQFSDLNYGNPFSDSIEQMRIRLLSYKSEKKDLTFQTTAKAILSFDTTQKYSPSVVKQIESNLEKFVNELVNERLASLSPNEKKQALNLASKLGEIGEHVGSSNILRRADQLQLAVLQTHEKYRSLMSELPISFNDLEKAQSASNGINLLVRNIAPFFREEAPNISRADMKQLLTRLYETDDALVKVGILDEESPISEAIVYLEKALGVPSRPRSLPKKEEEKAVVLEPIKEKAKAKQPSKTAVSALRAEIEKREISQSSPSVIPKSTQAPKKILSLEDKRCQSMEKLQRKLSRLEKLTSFEIYELISHLKEDKKLFPENDQGGIDALILALETLRNPAAFKPSSSEAALINRWGALLNSYGITSKSYERTITPVQREIKAELIDTIKANRDSFLTLQKSLAVAIPQLETKAISKRFIGAEVVATQTKKFSSEMALNLANTVRHLEGFKKETEDYFHSKWTTVVGNFDTPTKGKFSKVIEHLGYCNLEKHADTVSLSIVEKHLKTFLSPELFGKAANQSLNDFAATLTELRDQEVALYQAETRTKYNSVRSDLIWIRGHVDFIKKVYDQGSDINRNMDKGTCERNSEDRVKLLLKNPRVASDQIDMGSTQIGRFNQVARNIAFKLKDVNQQESIKMLKKSYERVGLNLDSYNKIAVQKNQNPQEALCSELARLVIEENKTIFILGMTGEDGEGHAINIQVDLDVPIFRFIDDNIGVVECPDGKAFQEALTTWLKTAYPDLPNYTLMNLSAI